MTFRSSGSGGSGPDDDEQDYSGDGDGGPGVLREAEVFADFILSYQEHRDTKWGLIPPVWRDLHRSALGYDPVRTYEAFLPFATRNGATHFPTYGDRADTGVGAFVSPRTSDARAVRELIRGRLRIKTALLGPLAILVLKLASISVYGAVVVPFLDPGLSVIGMVVLFSWLWSSARRQLRLYRAVDTPDLRWVLRTENASRCRLKSVSTLMGALRASGLRPELVVVGVTGGVQVRLYARYTQRFERRFSNG